MSTASRETIIIVYEKLLRIISLPLPPDCSTVFLKSFSQLCNHFWQFMFFWIIMFFNDRFSSFSAMYFLFFSNYLAFTLFFSFFICLSNKFICSFWQPFILLFRALNVFHPFFRFSNNFILGQSILSFAIYHLFVCSSIYSYIQSCIPFSNHYSFFRQWILLSVILNPNPPTRLSAWKSYCCVRAPCACASNCVSVSCKEIKRPAIFSA